MLRTRLLNSTTFRLTVLYLGLFSLSALAILGTVYYLSVRFVDRQTKELIEVEVRGLTQELRDGGIGRLRDVVAERSAAERNLKSIYSLIDLGDGSVLAGNFRPSADHLLGAAEGDFLHMETLAGDWGRPAPESRLALVTAVDIGERFILFVGRDIQEKVQTLQRIRLAIGAGVMSMLVLGGLGGYAVSRWMLRRLDVINRTTARIMAGELSRRISVSDTGDEFDELARNVNAMLDRIDSLLQGMRQVTDDVAHDLRTPLNRLRSRIEVALMRDPAPDEARELLEATIRDADGLIETFDALLSIARAEAGGVRGEREPIDLGHLVGEVAELYEPLAEDKGILLVAEPPPPGPPVEVTGNRQLVAQAIANLADNAIKYTPAGGRVWLRVHAAPAPRVEVADNGPGIPAEDRERAKRRFVRLDATRGTPGSGLGLSLAEAVAKLHDARLDLLDNEPGLKVWLTFPVATDENGGRAGAPLPPRPPAPGYAGGAVGADRGAG